MGSQDAITAVMESIGFHYRWDPVNKMFFHASGVMVVTPEGRVARYLYGVEYEPKDLKLSLVEASHNRIGSAGGSDSAVLLPLRSDNREIWRCCDKHAKDCALFLIAVMGVGLFFLWRRDFAPIGIYWRK